MKFKLTTIIVVALSLLIVARAQKPQGLNRATTSSIKSEQDKDGNIVITTINRDFKLMDEPCPLDAPKPYTSSLLLLREFTSKQASNREGEQGTIKVEAWLGQDVDALSKKWEFQQEGHTGEPVDCFYKVTKYGCCMARATDVYYSLITGEKVFTSNSPLFGITVPNTTITLDRYFAYLSADNVFGDRLGAKAADFVAVIQYGSETSLLNRIAIYSERAEYLLPPKISLRYNGKSVDEKGLMLWTMDGKTSRSSLSDFALVLSYEKSGDVVIPVHDDSPDIAKATVPKQFRLESLSSTTKGPQTARAN
jgi:hypothetical protein